MFIPLEAGHLHEEGGGFFTEYFDLLTSPAHIAFELTLMIIIDVILLGLLVPAVRRYVNYRLQKQHAELDAEHGIQHHDDHVHVARPGTTVDCEDPE